MLTLLVFLFFVFQKIYAVGILENLPISPVVQYPGNGISSGRYIIVKEYLQPIQYQPKGLGVLRTISLGTWTFVVFAVYLATEFVSYFENIESVEQMYQFLIGTIPIGTAMYNFQFVSLFPFQGQVYELAQGYASTIDGYQPGYHYVSDFFFMIVPWVTGEFFFFAHFGLENFENSFFVVADQVVGPTVELWGQNGVIYERVRKEVQAEHTYSPYRYAIAVEEYLRYKKQYNPQAVSTQYQTATILDDAVSGIRIRSGVVYIATFVPNGNEEYWVPVDNVEVQDGKTVEDILDEIELVSDQQIDIQTEPAPSDVSNDDKNNWVDQFSQLYMKFPFSIPYDIFYIYNLALVSNNVSWQQFLEQFSWNWNFLGQIYIIRLSDFYHPAYDSFLYVLKVIMTIIIVVILLAAYRRLIW